MDKKIAVSCPTKDLFKKVENKAFKMGITWFDKDLRHKDWWESYKENTCLDISTDSLKYSPEDFYQRQDYTIIPAEEWLGQEKKPSFKIGEKVEVVDGFLIGQKAKIEEIDSKEPKYLIRYGTQNAKSIWLKTKELKLSEEHTAPLREGDGVRVVGEGAGYKGQEGVIKRIDGCDNTWTFYIEFSKGLIKCHYTLPDLELIPTEADITVGSVWEGKGETKWETKINPIIEIRGNRVYTEKDGCYATFKDLLLQHKLIHRGDEEVKGYTHIVKQFDGNIERVYIDGVEQKQTNKKEKKMKTKVIKEGLPIIDKACDNLGVVVYYDPESREVAYKEPNGKHTIGHIDNIQLAPVQVVMPEPKPEKKKVVKKKVKAGK